MTGQNKEEGKPLTMVKISDKISTVEKEADFFVLETMAAVERKKPNRFFLNRSKAVIFIGGGDVDKT